MNVNHFVAYITDQLAAWGVNYSENVAGLKVGTINLEVSDGDDAARITNGEETVAITSDADKAAALLSFPLARRAWELGYTGDFEVTYVNSEVEMILSYGSSDLAISAEIDKADRFTITEHDLFRQIVCMSDLEAVLTSTELAYSDPDEAWQVLCGASDFESDPWESIVEFFDGDATFIHGSRFTAVESNVTGTAAMVEGWKRESPMRVINVETAEDTTHWSMSDVAAAVLYAIA